MSEKRGGLPFITRSYPKFGRGLYSEKNPPSAVRNSPFFWWFKFLQLNEDYAACVRGENDAHADLVADFGDVKCLDFKTWWREHAWLFTEERSGYSMQIAECAADLAPFKSDDAVNVVVPLNLPHRSLLKSFRKLVLSRVPKQQRRVDVAESTAKYKLARWNIYALETAYRVYTLKRDNQQLAWADVALRAKLNVVGIEGMQEGDKRPTYVDVRRRATTLAMRYNGYAKGYIKAAASTCFPR
jgi:hypothetical protein